MTVSLTYDAQLSRVRITATSLGAALTAVVERSTDQTRWSTVRGGSEVAVTAGTMAGVDDYEFAADVPNYYRVTYRNTITYVAAGTSDTDNNASVTPGVPAGTTTGDVLLMFAGIRNFGVGSVNIPAGWTNVLSMGSGNVKLLAKTAGASESTPTVTFTGGAAGADTAAQMIALRGVDLNSLVSNGDTLASSVTNITTPALVLDDTWYGGEVLYLGWKADDWSGAALASGTEIAEMVSTAGSDMGMVWNHREIAESVHFDNLGTQTFTITGSTTASVLGGVAALQAARLTQTNSITPALGGVWLKFIARPFLNTLVRPWGDLRWSRKSRNGVFDVVGRSLRVSVSDVRLSREGDLQLITETVDDFDRLDLVLSGGDPVFLHTPADSPLPTMYADVGDVDEESPVPGTFFFTLPLIQVSAPAPEIVGATATCQMVLSNYDTCADVLAAFATCQDVLEEIAQPGDIEVS